MYSYKEHQRNKFDYKFGVPYFKFLQVIFLIIGCIGGRRSLEHKYFTPVLAILAAVQAPIVLHATTSCVCEQNNKKETWLHRSCMGSIGR